MNEQMAAIPLPDGAIRNFMGTITYRTKPCMSCGQQSLMKLDAAQHWHWAHGGMFVQDAFPEMPADEREMLLTGTHPNCWSEMLGGRLVGPAVDD